MVIDLLYHEENSKNIAAIINGYDPVLYHEQKKENISDLSIPILQKN